MTLEEYQEKLKKLKEEYNLRETDLAREFCMSNNTVKVGDIIEDHIGPIRVEQIQFTKRESMLSTVPQCVYSGAALTKKLLPRKNGEQYRTVYATNMKKQE